MTQGYLTRRAIVVTDQGTYYGHGRTSPARPDQRALLTDLPRLLAGAPMVISGGEGVLMVGGGVRVADMQQPDPASGWRFTMARPWTTYTNKDAGQIIHVGILAELDAGRTPLFRLDDDPDTIATVLDKWHATIGHPWFGVPGMVGVGMLRQAHRRPGPGAQPLWTYDRLPRGLRGVGPLIWHRELPADGAGWVHLFDTNASYLAALKGAAVAWGALERTGAAYDMQAGVSERVAGFFTIDATGLPPEITGVRGDRPPVVPYRLIRDGQATVTAPVMRYLCQVGINPDVWDSWTTDNTQTIGRSVAERLSAARTGMLGPITPGMLAGVKSVYAETVGMIGKSGGRIDRRDWMVTFVDHARMNFTRRLDRVERATGLWPVRIETDSAAYLTDDPDPDALGSVLGLGVGPGTMRHTATYTVREYRAMLAEPLQRRLMAQSK